MNGPLKGLRMRRIDRMPCAAVAAALLVGLPASAFLVWLYRDLPTLPHGFEPIHLEEKRSGLAAGELATSAGPAARSAEAGELAPAAAEPAAGAPDNKRERPGGAPAEGVETDKAAPHPEVRRLAAAGAAAASRLEELLFDRDIPESIRIESALALANIPDSPEALGALLRAMYSEIDDDREEPVFKEVLRAALEEHFDQIADLAKNLLDHPDIDAATKIAAIEALTRARGEDVIPILLKHAASPDAEIREAAVWAIAGRDDLHRARHELADLLLRESTALVRGNLYEALRLQSSVDVTPFWEGIYAEEHLGTRLAGMNLIATHLPNEATVRFGAEIVPELQLIATADRSLSNRVSAITALARAGKSPEAGAALQMIWQSSLDSQTRDAAALAIH